MFKSLVTDGSMYGEVCASIVCQYSSSKPKAVFYHTWKEKWLCLKCGQEENAKALQSRRAAGLDMATFKRPCISSEERMLQILSGQGNG